MIEPQEGYGQTFDVGEEVTLGRAAGCGVRVEDSYTSNLHARLFRRNGTLWVEDLGSTNGTWVNAERIADDGQTGEGRPAPGGWHRLRGGPVTGPLGTRSTDVGTDELCGGSLTVLRSGSASDVGRVRTVNEDLALESLTLFAVADGMGGHVGGEIAARTAIETLQAEFARKPDRRRAGGGDPRRQQGRVGARPRGRRPAGHGHHDDRGRPGGDRRRRPVGARQRRATPGPTVCTATTWSSSPPTTPWPRSWWRDGELSEEEAAVHPHRHILTRALGVQPEVAVDVWQLVPEEGDRFLLCSDGLTNEVLAEEITDVLVQTRDPREAAETLVRHGEPGRWQRQRHRGRA